jgi:hypothetical protein
METWSGTSQLLGTRFWYSHSVREVYLVQSFCGGIKNLVQSICTGSGPEAVHYFLTQKAMLRRQCQKFLGGHLICNGFHLRTHTWATGSLDKYPPFLQMCACRLGGSCMGHVWAL